MIDEELVVDRRSNIWSYRNLDHEIPSRFCLGAQRQDERWPESELCCTDIRSTPFGGRLLFLSERSWQFGMEMKLASLWTRWWWNSGKYALPWVSLQSKRQVTNNSEGIHYYINVAETKLAGRRHDVWGSRETKTACPRSCCNWRGESVAKTEQLVKQDGLFPVRIRSTFFLIL